MEHEIAFSDPGASGVIGDLQTILSLIRQIKREGGGIGVGVGGGRGSGVGGIDGRGTGGTTGTVATGTVAEGLGKDEERVRHERRRKVAERSRWRTENRAWRVAQGLMGADADAFREIQRATSRENTLMRRPMLSPAMTSFMRGPSDAAESFFSKANLKLLWKESGKTSMKMGKKMLSHTLNQALPGIGRGVVRAVGGQLGVAAAVMMGAHVIDEMVYGDDPQSQSALRFTGQRWRQLWDKPKNELERRNFAIHESAKQLEGGKSWMINNNKSLYMWNWSFEDPVNRGMVADIAKIPCPELAEVDP